MRRILVSSILIAALGTAAWWAWPDADAATGARLRTAEVDRGSITSVVAATGTVNPVVSVQVGSQLSGQIRELFADFNTQVRAGEPIARLDTATIEARRAAAAADLQAAQAAVVVARAQAEKAEADQDAARAALAAARANVDALQAQTRDAAGEASRATELRARGVGASRDAERAAHALDRARAAEAQGRAQAAQAEAALVGAEAAARTAAAQVQAAEAAAAQRAAQLRQVEVDLKNATIRAPIDGIVVSRSVDLGQTVAASLQSPVLFTIAASLNEMEIWATVDEADIGRIRPGQDVSFTVAAHPGITMRGRVKEIRLAAETVQNVVTYTVVISAANPGGRLLPGMTATLRVVTDSRDDVLRVPNAALRWRPPGASLGVGPVGGGEGPGMRSGPVEQALQSLDDLTDAQRAELAAAQAELRQRMAELPQGGEARRRQAQAARQRLIAQLNAVLTPDQRARLAELSAAGGARRGGEPGTVWVLDAPDAAPRSVAVRTGVTDGNSTEIVGGDLEEGALVVVGTERATAGGGATASAGASPFGRRLF